MSARIIPLVLIAITASIHPVHARSFEYKEHHLGPTGLLGVTSPADIKITKVEQGSPADGKLKEGDVIVAVGGLPFKDNTRPLLAAAIEKAETAPAKGILSLGLEGGKTVDLQLEALDDYSATAPTTAPRLMPSSPGPPRRLRGRRSSLSMACPSICSACWRPANQSMSSW